MKYWECPVCKWRMGYDNFLYARYDYGCPDCKTSFSKFQLKEEKQGKKDRGLLRHE